MQGLLIYKFLLRRLFVLIFCLGLTACKEPPPLDIVKPLIDISHAERSIELDFKIDKPGNYQFALLFAHEGDHEELARQSNILGDHSNKGVVIPISLQLVKNGKIVFEENINTRGHGWIRSITYGEKSVNVVVRNIIMLELPPGQYSAVTTILQGAPDFSGIETFFQFAHYDPKV